MGDLIDRQAAIDALVIREQIIATDTPLFEALVLAENVIKALPSAQPEVIRCKECKYQRKGQNECEEWNLCGYRPWQYTPITDEHFCNYAERRTDE